MQQRLNTEKCLTGRITLCFTQRVNCSNRHDGFVSVENCRIENPYCLMVAQFVSINCELFH